MTQIMELGKRVLAGGALTPAEAEALINTTDEDTMLLLAMADKIRAKFRGKVVDCCAIINGRSGRCSENCKFCAQSAHYHTGVKEYPLLPEEAIVAAAQKAKVAGAVRFSLVTSGRGQNEAQEFKHICHALKRIKAEVKIEVCCSLGLLTLEQAYKLKEAGAGRFHANIETAPSFFPQICTTHNYADKMAALSNAKKAGLRLCSGGILGLGESLKQRVEMAFELRRLGIDSVPLNLLNPIAGTPLAHNKPLAPLEILRTFAVFRFILPKAQIRTAGGREVNLRDLQGLALNSGLDGMMIGGYLTTGGRSPKADQQLLKDLGRIVAQPVLN